MDKISGRGLTFDDVLLLPDYSEVLPDAVDVGSWLTPDIRLNIPLLSAAMDTVTESRMAISLARSGGVGVIHKNMPVDRQRLEVEKVKKSESGMIISPITVPPEMTVEQALLVMSEYSISGLPVVDGDQLVGIVTNRDVRFVKDSVTKVKDVMTKENLVTVPVGTTLEEAKHHLHQNRIEKLLVVDENNKLRGLITIKDIEKIRKYPNSCKDDLGRLRVGAAVGVGKDRNERVEALLDAGADFIVLDSAHGHSKNILDSIAALKSDFPSCRLVAGNVGTYEGAKALIKAGVDTVKVGIGPGSICTTRIVAGVGVPQITAIMDAVRACREHGRCLVADGGVKFSGDIVKAIAAGADTVMMGSLFAGTEESPGETILYQGRTYKIYRGMGSIDAMRDGSSDRYFQEKSKKLVPEGIVGRVPFKGPVTESIYQLVGGLKSGMGYCGCKDIAELQAKSRFVRISTAGLRESHVHDVIITKEAPNYRVDTY
ncbi:MAG: IMP dehydrogenase [Desulfovibrio sp.]|nr:IMP dehydrogenase [Desulfovibrio sp.]